MTTGERLASLAGTTGAAATLLLLIGTGVTTGEALVNYSQLPTGTAAQHLLVEKVVDQPKRGGGYSRYIEHVAEKRQEKDLQDMLFMVIASGILDDG